MLRSFALTAGEIQLLAKVRKAIPITAIVMLLRRRVLRINAEDYLLIALVAEVLKYRELMYLPSIAREPISNIRSRTIDSFSEQQCWSYFRCRKGDLYRLKTAFRIPALVHAENGSVFTGEEVLLFSLYRYSDVSTIQKQCEHIFGRENTQFSRAFKWFNQHMLDEFTFLLVDNFRFWHPYFPAFADAIRRKLNAKSPPIGEPGHFEFVAGEFRIAFFFDCNVCPISAPGTGPRGTGADAGRDNNDEQRAFYNKWKCFHGIKWLTIEGPNGMVIFMYGPDSFVRNDCRLVNESGINELLEDCQQDDVLIFACYGDRIFVNNTCIARAFEGEDLTDVEVAINKAFTSLRVSIEWDYGLTSIKFPLTQYWQKNKIKASPLQSRQYFVATLMRNALVCLYGSITASYFDVRPPTLEEYFNVQN